MALDTEDWKRIEELVLMAGAASQRKDLEQFQSSDAMAFSTLGLAIMDIHGRLARLEATTYKPLVDHAGRPIAQAY